MSARDVYHTIVRSALEKDGWIVTDDPLYISIDDVDFKIDLAAEKVIAATKNNRKIAVEIKSFIGSSTVTEFHLALGQSLSYRSALRETEPDRLLYLAISSDIYAEFFSRPFIGRIIAEHQLNLLIFDRNKEDIILWKD
jgi:XisH protein